MKKVAGILIAMALLWGCSKTEKVTNTEIRTETDTLIVTQVDTIVVMDTVYVPAPEPDSIVGTFRFNSNCFYYLETVAGNFEIIVWDAAPADVDPYLNRRLKVLGGYDGNVIRCYPTFYCAFRNMVLQ